MPMQGVKDLEVALPTAFITCCAMLIPSWLMFGLSLMSLKETTGHGPCESQAAFCADGIQLLG